jgi:hypothetical protein
MQNLILCETCYPYFVNWRVFTKGVGRQDAENRLHQLRAFAVSQSWTMADTSGKATNGW